MPGRECRRGILTGREVGLSRQCNRAREEIAKAAAVNVQLLVIVLLFLSALCMRVKGHKSRHKVLLNIL